MPDRVLDNPEVRKAFGEYDRQETIYNFKVASIVGMILMPLGIPMDYYMYPHLAGEFLQLRFACSSVIGIFLAILLSPFGVRHYRFQGVLLFMVPSSFIAWMIYRSPDGAASPYYAGLNLVLLVLAFLLHWTFRESLAAAALVVVLYLGASLASSVPITTELIGRFSNNIFFLACTVIIVVTGSYFHSIARFREFALRYELDQNKKALEQKTADLETAIIRLKEAEAGLVQSEKLASLGRMSAGIIHEVNNPLNYIKTNLYTLKNKAKHLPAEQLGDYTDTVKDIEDGIDRVKTIVSDLRGFTTHSDAQRDEVAVSDLVDASVRFVSHEWGDSVQLQRNLTDGQTIWANKNKLIQVLVNLLENSLDALRAKQFTNGELPFIRIESRVEGGASILTVRDNGPGIKNEHLNKIFDPFFTTKDVGAGMGLGLSICYRIVQDFDGRISVKTEPGKFTEFALEFPAKG